MCAAVFSGTRRHSNGQLEAAEDPGPSPGLDSGADCDARLSRCDEQTDSPL